MMMIFSRNTVIHHDNMTRALLRTIRMRLIQRKTWLTLKCVTIVTHLGRLHWHITRNIWKTWLTLRCVTILTEHLPSIHQLGRLHCDHITITIAMMRLTLICVTVVTKHLRRTHQLGRLHCHITEDSDRLS